MIKEKKKMNSSCLILTVFCFHYVVHVSLSGFVELLTLGMVLQFPQLKACLQLFS